MACINDKEHQLQNIYISQKWDGCDVVRWCKVCGGVVVDFDYDGRTNAGQIRSMEFPKISTGEDL